MIIVSSKNKVVHATLCDVDTALRLEACGHRQSTGDAGESADEAGKGNHDDYLCVFSLKSILCS